MAWQPTSQVVITAAVYVCVAWLLHWNGEDQESDDSVELLTFLSFEHRTKWLHPVSVES